VSDALDFLRIVHPNGPWVVTSFTGGRAAGVQARPGEEGAVLKFLEANAEADIYTLLGRLEDGESASTTPHKEAIAGSRWAWVDLDPESEDPGDFRQRQAGLLQTDQRPPTMIIDSGRGLWALWRLDREVDRQELERLNAGLRDRYVGDPSGVNCNKVGRLPGTLNTKTGRHAALIHYNEDLVYRPEDLPMGEVWTCELPDVDLDFDAAKSVDLEELTRRLGLEPGTQAKILAGYGYQPWATDQPPLPPEQIADRSPHVIEVGKAMLNHGATDQEVLEVFLERDFGISHSIYLERDGDSFRPRRNYLKYAVRQVARCRVFYDRDQAAATVAPEPTPFFTEDFGTEEKPRPLELISVTPLGELKPRPWLIPGLLLDGHVTMLTGRGGASKSMLAMHLAVACALNRPFAQWVPKETRRVLMLQAEDDLDEQRRRVAAICAVEGVPPDMLNEKLLTLPRQNLALIQRDPDDGKVKPTQLYSDLESAMRERDVGLIVIDPLVEAHVGLDENSNIDMKELLIGLRALARTRAIPFLLVHHSRKGSGAGDLDGARGASALVNATRVSLNIERVPRDFKIKDRPVENADRLVRVVNGKANYSALEPERFLELRPVELDCGEVVAALVQGSPDLEDEEELRENILRLAKQGRENGEPWRIPARGKRAEICLHGGAAAQLQVTRDKARRIIDELVREKRLLVKDCIGANRHTFKGYVVPEEPF
jgi:hypothetical protein